MKRDLIIFSGQSNMQGQSEINLEYKKIDNAYEYKYLSNLIVPLSNPIGENITYDLKEGYGIDSDEWTILSKWLDNHAFGASFLSHSNLVPFFVKEYIEETKHEVIVVHAAKGSTSINDWQYESNIYNALKNKVNKAIELIGKDKLNHIYFVWYQGESDAIFKMPQDEYKNKLIEFKNHLKEDFNIAKFGIIKVGAFTNNSFDDNIKNAQEEVLIDEDFVMLTRLNDSLVYNEKYMSKLYKGHLNAYGLELVGKDAGLKLAKVENNLDNLLKNYNFKISEAINTPFIHDNNIYQDGTTPIYRDIDGKLYAMSGHSHKGEIAMFCGTNMHNLKKLYPIKTNFEVGKAKVAFNGIAYPDGIDSRGSVWPFGLYICPTTHRFFAFFHNETGWAGMGTAYDSLGPCDIPYSDSDFRHIGLMYSDDEGKTWNFDRWIIAGNEVACTEKYNPSNLKLDGQKLPLVNLGSGDFSIYVDEKYIYIFYNIIYVDVSKPSFERIDVYVARSKRRYDGIMNDFVKYHNGSFIEPGVLGKETPIVYNAWHSHVNKLEDLGIYVMTYSPKVMNNKFSSYDDGGNIIKRQVTIRTSNDLVNWSKPIELKKDGNTFGDHYCAMYPNNENDDYIIKGNKLVIQLNGNGTNVVSYDIEID